MPLSAASSSNNSSFSGSSPPRGAPSVNNNRSHDNLSSGLRRVDSQSSFLVKVEMGEYLVETYTPLLLVLLLPTRSKMAEELDQLRNRNQVLGKEVEDLKRAVSLLEEEKRSMRLQSKLKMTALQKEIDASKSSPSSSAERVSPRTSSGVGQSSPTGDAAPIANEDVIITSHNNNHNADVVRLDVELKEALKAKQLADSRILVLEQQSAESQARAESLTLANQALTADLDSKSLALEQSLMECQALKFENNNLLSSVTTYSSSSSSASSSASPTTNVDDVERLTRLLAEKDTEIEKLRSSLGSAPTQMQPLAISNDSPVNNTSIDKQEDSKRLLDTIQTLQTQVFELSDSNSSLKHRLESETSKLETALTESTRLQMESEEINSRLTRLETERDTLSTELERIKNELVEAAEKVKGNPMLEQRNFSLEEQVESAVRDGLIPCRVSSPPLTSIAS